MSRATLLIGIACGLASATTPSTGAGAQPRLDAVGVQGGAIVRTGENSETLIGAQARLGLTSRLSLVTELDLRADFPDDPTGAWRGTAFWWVTTARISAPRPVGFVSIGGGLAIGRASAENTTRSLDLSETAVREVVVVGVGIPIWRLRPFADLHLVDAIRAPTEPSSHLTVGLGVSVR